MAETVFQITSDLAPLRNAQITANFEEVHAFLTEELAPYRELAVTPETIPQAKTYRASIRKIRDRIDENRKLAKAAALSAYEPFEAKCKQLTALCDEAANAIDAQVKAFEDARKAEKINALWAYFDVTAAARDVDEYITFEDVYNKRWENSTFTEQNAREEIDKAVARCENDLSAIKQLNSEFYLTLLDYYRTTHDLASVIAKNNALMAAKAAEDKRRETEQKAQAVLAEAIQHGQDEAQRIDAAVEQVAPEVRVVKFWVKCTKPQLNELGAFLVAHGIEYGPVRR